MSNQTQTQTKTIAYREIPATAVPQGVRFDVPRRNQGQMIEVAYGGLDRGEHDEGDLYERITDASSREVTYGRLIESDLD